MRKLPDTLGKLVFVLGFAAIEATMYKITDKFTPDIRIPLLVVGVVLVMLGKK